MAEFAERFDVHPNQITQWKTQLLERSADVFDTDDQSKEPPVDVKTRHAKIGELILENEFFEGALNKAGSLSKKDDRPRPQAADKSAGQTLNISRGTAYYQPRPTSPRDQL